MLILENLLNQAGEWIILQEFASYPSKLLKIKQSILRLTESKGLYMTKYDADTASKSTYEQTVLPVPAQVAKHMQRHCSMISQIMSG